MKLVAILLVFVGSTAAINIHPAREEEIALIKARTSLWQPGPVARFATSPPGSSRKMNGVIHDWKMAVSVELTQGNVERFIPQKEVPLPRHFDAATAWPMCAKIIDDIRDQSNCGCCWAFAGAEAASDRLCIASNGTTMVPISAQDVCFNSNVDGCNGGQITTPWTYIKSTGAVSGGQYNNSGPFGAGLCSDFSLPHCHHHGPQGSDPYPDEGDAGCPSYSSPRGPTACDADSDSDHSDFNEDKYTFAGSIQVASGEKEIMQMIYEGGPVETAFTVYSDFENYVSGIYEHVAGVYSGGHAVKIVGWGEENGVRYWKIANSWNPYWGESGYFRIKKGTNECGVENEVTGSPTDASWVRAGDKA